MYFLDTNTVIYFLNGKFESVRENLLSTPPTEIRIPVIVKAELLAGAFGSRSKETTLAKLNLFLGHFQTVSLSDDAAEKYAEIVSTLKRKGTPIGPNDALIAATVLANNGTIVTHNTSEFGRVDGLLLTDWVEE